MNSATLALLGFMLAVTFSIAIARYDARRQALFREVNGLGTAFLRADLLPFGQRAAAKSLLREYVNARVAATVGGELSAGIKRSEEIQVALWSLALRAEEQSNNPVAVSLFVQALNSVIDLHAERITAAFHSRIPVAVWMVLYVAAVLSMAGIGYQAGSAGSARSPTVVALMVSFSAVLWLVASLDRPLEGALRISQQVMEDLATSMAVSELSDR